MAFCFPTFGLGSINYAFSKVFAFFINRMEADSSRAAKECLILLFQVETRHL
jgi:hypothetical protein